MIYIYIYICIYIYIIHIIYIHVDQFFIPNWFTLFLRSFQHMNAPLEMVPTVVLVNAHELVKKQIET